MKTQLDSRCVLLISKKKKLFFGLLPYYPDRSTTTRYYTHPSTAQEKQPQQPAMIEMSPQKKHFPFRRSITCCRNTSLLLLRLRYRLDDELACRPILRERLAAQPAERQETKRSGTIGGCHSVLSLLILLRFGCRVPALEFIHCRSGRASERRRASTTRASS